MKMNNHLATALYIIFLFSTVQLVASETIRGGATVGRSGIPVSLNRPVNVMKADSCPPALVDWVNDDFKNKKDILSNTINTLTGAESVRAGISLVEFPSEVKACQLSVKSYEASLKKSGNKTPLSDAEGMSNYLADRYRQISPNAKNVLNTCNSLPEGKDKVIKSRYYMAMAKMEAVNSTVLDEMAYIDSLIPSGQVIPNMECNKIFPFPQVGMRCDDYKNLITGSCKLTQDQRLNTMVEKTRLIMPQLEELQSSYLANCKTLSDQSLACQNLNAALQILKSEVPWVDGKMFQEKSSLVQVNNFWNDKLKDEKLRQGIIDQLNFNRKSYLKQYSTNLDQAKCLTYSKSDGKALCDFENTRQYIAALPDVVAPAQLQTIASAHYDNYIEAENCLIERGMERAATKKIVDDSIGDLAIMVSTLGISAAASGGLQGLKVIKGMGTASKLRNAAFSEAALAGLNLGSGVKQAIQSCREQTANFLKFAGKPEATKDTFCPDTNSNIEIAQSKSTSCLIDALLTAVNVWPLIKNLKMASSLSKEGILDLFKDPKQRAEVEKILAKNGNLSEVERKQAADTMLGRTLSAAEKDCVIATHKLGGDRFMKITASDANVYTQSDLLAKKSRLTSCGFGSTEIALLMRSGITGGVPEIASINIRAAAKKVFGRDLLADEVNAIWDVAEKSQSDAVAILKKIKSFSDAEINLIVDRKLQNIPLENLTVVAVNEPAKRPAGPVLSGVGISPTEMPLNLALTNAVQSGSPASVKEVMDVFRSNALKELRSNKEALQDNPSYVLDLGSRGLKIEEVTSLLGPTASAEEGLKRTMALIDRKILSVPDVGVALDNYTRSRLQEIKVRLMEDYYATKYPDYGSLDRLKFQETDQAGYAVLQAAEKKLAELKALSSQRWPKLD